MHSGVVCQFRMEGRRHNPVPLYQRWLPRIFRKYFYARTGSLDDRAANKYHFQRLLLQLRRAADHVARDLPPISISQHGHIQKFQRILFRIPHFRRKQDGAGTRSKDTVLCSLPPAGSSHRSPPDRPACALPPIQHRAAPASPRAPQNRPEPPESRSSLHSLRIELSESQFY